MEEHLFHPLPADMVLGWTINTFCESNVGGRHSFRDCAGRAAHLEKPSGNFLPRSNFGKGAVLRVVEIDLESLVVGIKDFPAWRMKTIFIQFHQLSFSGQDQGILVV
jgi:hypothetical protein